MPTGKALSLPFPKYGVIPGSEVKYIPKVVAPTLDVVRSVGGFRTLPDYSFSNDAC